jgi:hypothetical protein
METTNNTTESIFKSGNSSISDLTPLNSGTISSTTESGSFFDKIKNISGVTWIIIILVLAFLGFNIFIYLAKGTNDITDFLQQIFQKVMDIFTFISNTIINYTSQGVGSVVNKTTSAINTVEGTIEGTIEGTPQSKSSTSSSSPVENTIPQPDVTRNNTMNKAINTSKTQQSNSNEYEPNEAQSSVASSGKTGWCYVGKEEGYRTCINVGQNDVCMSGDIFPSQEICINPSLRT